MDCLAPPYDAPQTELQREIATLVDWLRSRLEPYPPLFSILIEAPPEICLGERLIGAHGYFEMETSRIALGSTLSPALMRAVAVHELRHIHQVRVGACLNPGLSMQATGRTVLAMEADASAISLAIAWELKQAGEPEVWAALSHWRSYTRLAEAFEAGMRESGDIALATSSAFAEWYEIDWRREAYYKNACSAYLDREDANHALPRYGSIEPGFFETLCTLPDGIPYPCMEPAGTGQE
ncbi:MAG: hypothetical protein QNJ35_01045 [Paracoccaceae bacterium]|nr:hypothetical protein [Paracoccaceae bacterium]